VPGRCLRRRHSDRRAGCGAGGRSLASVAQPCRGGREDGDTSPRRPVSTLRSRRQRPHRCRGSTRTRDGIGPATGGADPRTLFRCTAIGLARHVPVSDQPKTLTRPQNSATLRPCPRGRGAPDRGGVPHQPARRVQTLSPSTLPCRVYRRRPTHPGNCEIGLSRQ
jgi:hypothetical protein